MKGTVRSLSHKNMVLLVLNYAKRIARSSRLSSTRIVGSPMTNFICLVL